MAEHRKGDHADDDRQQRPSSRSQPHGEQGGGEQLGGQINARDTHQGDGDDVVQKGEDGLLTGTEIAAEAEVDAGKDAVPDVPTEILPAGALYCAVVGEQPHHRFRDELNQTGDDKPEA